MHEENVLLPISHQCLPNPFKTEVLPLKLQVISHAEHNTTIYTEQL